MIQQLHRALGFAGERDDVARRERLRHFLGDLDLDSADMVEEGPPALGWGAGADDPCRPGSAFAGARAAVIRRRQARSP